MERLPRQAGVGLIGKMMDRHYRRSRLNTQIRFNLADVYVYRSEHCYYYYYGTTISSKLITSVTR